LKPKTVVSRHWESVRAGVTQVGVTQVGVTQVWRDSGLASPPCHP
jgi:hypothetical protein